MLRAISSPITVQNDLVVMKEVLIDLNGAITSLMFNHRYIPKKKYFERISIKFEPMLNRLICRQGFHSLYIYDDTYQATRSFGCLFIYAIIPEGSTILIGDSDDIVSNNIIVLDKIVGHHPLFEEQRKVSEVLLTRLGLEKAA